MLKRRGSFKVAPGVRLNYGKRGFTSVNVAGVNLGSGRRSGGRPPSKAAILAENWRLRPGFYDVRIEIDDQESMTLVVNGAELTYGRMNRIMEGLYDGNTEAVARAFRAFVRAWDVIGDDGKPLPINKQGVDRLGIDLIFGLSVSVANALNIPKKPLGNVLTDRSTGKPLRISVSETAPMSSNAAAQSMSASSALPASPAENEGGEKSTAVAYLFWLILGLVGGHRYYLGRTGTAILQTLTLGGVGVWWLIDILLLPGLVKATNNERRLSALNM